MYLFLYLVTLHELELAKEPSLGHACGSWLLTSPGG